MLDLHESRNVDSQLLLLGDLAYDSAAVSATDGRVSTGALADALGVSVGAAAAPLVRTKDNVRVVRRSLRGRAGWTPIESGDGVNAGVYVYGVAE